jgi:membrane-associated phospholipid phosphatase
MTISRVHVRMRMNLDLAVLHAVNGFCGNWTLDRLAMYEENNLLFKGGLFLALYWWFWFTPEPDRRQGNRRIIVIALIGTVLALALNRALADMLPFRVRPMYALNVGYREPSIPFQENLEHWSSFPSDNATYWFALSYGLYRLKRPLGLVAMLYSTVWMCLVRLYLGIHYPSDLVVGALLGPAVVWFVERWLARRETFTSFVMAPIFALEQKRPDIFYAVAFVVSFEFTVMFDDLRDLVRSLTHQLRLAGFVDIGEGDALFVLAAAGVVLVAGAASVLMLRRRRSGAAHRASSGLRPPTKIAN